MPTPYDTLTEDSEEEVEEENDTVPGFLQSKSAKPFNIRAFSMKLLEEGYNNEQVREKLVKELRRVRAIMMRSKSVAAFSRRLSSIVCLNPAENEEDCKSSFLAVYSVGSYVVKTSFVSNVC